MDWSPSRETVRYHGSQWSHHIQGSLSRSLDLVNHAVPNTPAAARLDVNALAHD